jgi:aspartate aminotransferase
LPTTFAASRRSALLRPTAVNAILTEVRGLQAQGRDVVSLMRGEPDLPTPPHVVEAAERALRAGRTQYPDNRGEPRLREAIAAKLQRENGLAYDPASEILVTTGATLGIHAALMALLDQGEVLLPDPVYDAYVSPIFLAGARPRPVRAAVRGNRFELDTAALDAAVTPASRLLLLNSPWNPTGTVFRRAELEAVADLALRRDLLVLSDEIYEAITYDGSRHLSPAALSPDVRERTILVNSLSKTYAMTGWRVGYCAGPAHIIQAMFLVLQQSSRGPATFVQDAAAEAISGSQSCVDGMRSEYARRRTRVLDSLAGIPRVRVLPPEGGFFAMVDIRETGVASDDARQRLLADHGVAVVHGAAYGAGGEGMLRVSFGAGGETLARGLERLRAGLSAL